MPNPGFGKDPRSFAFKVTIIGHASPRWNGAKNATEADRLNDALANQRAIAVRSTVEALLRQRLGDGVAIEYDLSNASGTRPRYISIATDSAGSRVSLRRARGDRNNNDDINRSVEVAVELITTKYVDTGRTVSLGRISAFTRYWYVSIKSLLVIGTIVPGPMTAFLELELKNSLSKKTARYRATVYGGGDPVPFSDTPDKNVGRADAPIVADEDIGFDDFDGETVRLQRMDLQLIVGAARYYLAFPGLGKDAFNYMGTEFGFGLPGGFIASGTLRMATKNPGDWYESDLAYEESHITEIDGRTAEALLVTFPTGSAVLPPAERQRLDQLIGVWDRRLR